MPGSIFSVVRHASRVPPLIWVSWSRSRVPPWGSRVPPKRWVSFLGSHQNSRVSDPTVCTCLSQVPTELFQLKDVFWHLTPNKTTWVTCNIVTVKKNHYNALQSNQALQYDKKNTKFVLWWGSLYIHNQWINFLGNSNFVMRIQL